MTTWVLIWIVISMGNGVTIGSTTFWNEGACKRAAEKIEGTARLNRDVTAFCEFDPEGGAE